MRKHTEYYERPGIQMVRQGRFMSMKNTFSKEEHQQFVGNFAKFREEIPARVTAVAAELEAELAKYASFDVLANFALAEYMMNPETYKEWAHEGRQAYVEYVALLILKGEFRPDGLSASTRANFERLRGLVEEVFELTTWYYVSERASRPRDDDSEAIDYFRYRTVLQNLWTRSPSYQHHLVDVLKGLFDKGRVSEWMLAELGFSLEQALAINTAVAEHGFEELARRHQLTKSDASKWKQAANAARKRKPLPEGFPREFAAELAKLSDKKLHRLIKTARVGYTFDDLGQTMSFTPEQISESAGVPLRATEQYLLLRSFGFGDIEPSFVMPSPTSPLQQCPIVHYGDRYIVPAYSWLDWGLRTVLEDKLNPDKPGAVNMDRSLWNDYQESRSEYLEREALDLLSRTLIHASAHHKLHYEVMEDGKLKTAELDGMVQMDRALFLIEAKAGVLTAPARRGARDRMKVDIGKLVADAHRQGLRAKHYIESVDPPLFTTRRGERIAVDKRSIDYVFIVTVTLEPLESFTAVLYDAAKLGIFTPGQLPWAISLTDLRVICEMTEFPSQLVHFLVRRSRLNEIARVTAVDELDWFAHYLLEGLYFEDIAPEVTRYNLASYTTAFDDYYFYEQGYRVKPAQKPRQQMPPMMRTLLQDMERVHPQNYLLAAMMLLDMSTAERNKFAKMIQKIELRAMSDGEIHDATLYWNRPDLHALTVMVGRYQTSKDLERRLESFIRKKGQDSAPSRWAGIGSLIGPQSTFSAYLAAIAAPPMPEIPSQFPMSANQRT